MKIKQGKGKKYKGHLNSLEYSHTIYFLLVSTSTIQVQSTQKRKNTLQTCVCLRVRFHISSCLGATPCGMHSIFLIFGVSFLPSFPGEKNWYGNCMCRDDPSLNIRSTLNCSAGRIQSLSSYHGKWLWLDWRISTTTEKKLSFKKIEIALFSNLNYHFLSQLQFPQYWAKLREGLLQLSSVRVPHFVKYNLKWSWWW